MIINTRGIELNENVYVNKEGKFLFKIEKFEEDGFTNNGDARFKLHFKGGEIIENKVQSDITYTHSEQFNIGQSSLWRIKQVEVALKAPEVYDINDFVGRYIIANIKSESYTKKDGTAGTAYKVKSWEYSDVNDKRKLPPIPEAITNEDNGVIESIEQTSKIPEIDIDEDEIPF